MRTQAGESSEPRKITRASVACVPCRQKKVKCIIRDGEETCTSCRDHNWECVVLSDDRRKTSRLSRVYVSALQDRIRLLESTVQQLGQQKPVVGKASNDLAPPPPHVDEDVSSTPPLDLRREISSENLMGAREPLATEGLGPQRTNDVDLQPGNDSVPLPHGTTSEEEDVQLEEAYWSGQNAVLPLVMKPLFVDDRTARRSQYYSRALQACMIAVAARSSTNIGSSRQSQIHSTVCQMIRVKDHQDTSLATVQSLLLLTDLECAVGNWAHARSLHLKAGEMISQIVEASTTLPATTSTLADEAVCRAVIFYSVTSQFWHILDGPVPSAPPLRREHIEKFLSKSYPSQQERLDADSPSRRSICSFWMELMRISIAAATLEQSSRSSTDSTIELESLARLDAECHDWYCRLPWNLRCQSKSRPTPPPEFLVLLMCYHCTLIQLHRKRACYGTTAANEAEESFSPPIALSSISRTVCLKNSIRLSGVFSQYREHYQVSYLGIRAVLFIAVASTTLVAEIDDGQDGPEQETQKKHLAGLLDAFMEVSETLKFAELPTRIFSRLANPSAAADSSLDLALPNTDLLADLVASFAGMEDLEQGAQVP